MVTPHHVITTTLEESSIPGFKSQGHVQQGFLSEKPMNKNIESAVSLRKEEPSSLLKSSLYQTSGALKELCNLPVLIVMS